MMETFTSDELRAAGSRLGQQQAVNGVLAALEDTVRYSTASVAGAAGEQACVVIMEDVIAEARRLREPSIANDDDVLTVGELRAWVQERFNSPGTIGVTLGRDSVDKIMADIVKHREPEYPEGIVVRDRKGKFYQRISSSTWRGFDGRIISDGSPVRPLMVIS
jgi:hypothetical protein